MKCQFCDGEAAGLYAVTIDGVPLHLQPRLCVEHGERLILRFGVVIGSLNKPVHHVFVDWPAPLVKPS